MTKEEVDQIIDILLEADGGCPYCCDHLIQRFAQVFPEHGSQAQHKYNERFGKCSTEVPETVGDYKYTFEYNREE